MNGNDVYDLVAQVAPEFQEELTYQTEKDAGFKTNPYGILSEFSFYIVDRIKTGKLDGLSSVFETIERMMVEGDDAVGNAAATCFLENLQNTGCPPERWVPLLGPTSRAYCIAWDAFTGVYTPGLI